MAKKNAKNAPIYRVVLKNCLIRKIYQLLDVDSSKWYNISSESIEVITNIRKSLSSSNEWYTGIQMCDDIQSVQCWIHGNKVISRYNPCQVSADYIRESLKIRNVVHSIYNAEVFVREATIHISVITSIHAFVIKIAIKIDN